MFTAWLNYWPRGVRFFSRVGFPQCRSSVHKLPNHILTRSIRVSSHISDRIFYIFYLFYAHKYRSIGSGRYCYNFPLGGIKFVKSGFNQACRGRKDPSEYLHWWKRGWIIIKETHEDKTFVVSNMVQQRERILGFTCYSMLIFR